ncbi:MAG: hypothetical protein ACOY3P_06920 [Planctomycetota bacterium]
MSSTMPAVSPLPALARMLDILCTSAAAYLQDASPWTGPNHSEFASLIRDMAADQRHYAERTARAIDDRDGLPTPASFPLAFSSINDLAADYLVRHVTDLHRRDVEALRQCVSDLAEWPELHTLAEEVLGNAIGHLEILEKV